MYLNDIEDAENLLLKSIHMNNTKEMLLTYMEGVLSNRKNEMKSLITQIKERKIMKDISIIIPIHEYNSEVKTLMTRAINSVPNDYYIFVSTIGELFEDFKWVLELRDNIEITINEDSDKSDFCTLVNNVVMRLGTKWFSILEFDDVYTSIWFENVEKEIEYKPDVSVFYPHLEELIDFNTNKFIGYGNEAPWATSFSEEIGYIDNECLQQYFDFYLTGGVYNADDWRRSRFIKTIN